MNKDMFKTPDPKKTPGIRYVKPVMFTGGNIGEKIYIKTVKNGCLTYKFDAVYFKPKELLEGYEKRRARHILQEF